MSDIEANKKLACDFMKAFSDGDLELWASMMADDATYEVMGNSVMSGLRTKAEIVATSSDLFKVFPQSIKLTVLALTAEGDRVAMEARGNATTVSGKPYNNTYHLLFVIRDGKVKEGREYLCTKLVDQVLAPAN